jgi:monoamine oxidase
MLKPKTPLLRALQRSTPEETIDQAKPTLSSRRGFLKTTAKAAAFVGISSLIPEFTYASALKPKIAIVGAGIAGLNAAHYLKTKGFIATIYEASKRTGGRILTVTDKIGKGLTSEVGAEFIDTDHCEMFALVKKFGLKLKNGSKDPMNNGPLKETFFIDGRQYSLKEVLAEFDQYRPLIVKDNESVADENNLARLDKISITEYFNNLRMSGWFRTLMDNAYTSEFGIPVDEQSSLNFITMISSKLSDTEFNMYGTSDELYGIEGGNSMITKALTNYVNTQIRYEHQLQSIRSKGTGFTLSFTNGKEVNADFVVMTLPFTMLRSVEMKIDKMPEEKTMAIQELGYGNNSKLILGVNERTWRTNHKTAGYLFNEHIQNGWDSSHMQRNNQGNGSYTVFTGAKKAVDMANMAQQQQQLVDQYLPIMDNIFKGSKLAWNNNSIVADWPNQPFVKGSYAGYKVGQWSTIAGTEGTPVGNLIFAGEHCSEFQGFMNGGAESGKIAAREILKKMKVSLKTVCA